MLTHLGDRGIRADAHIAVGHRGRGETLPDVAQHPGLHAEGVGLGDGGADLHGGEYGHRS